MNAGKRKYRRIMFNFKKTQKEPTNSIKGMEEVVETMKNELGIAICPICGKQFVKKTATSVYCSKECSNEAIKASKRKYNEKLKARKEQEPKPEFKTHKHRYTCAMCGKGFLGINGQKYCSDECRAEKARQASHEWYIQNRQGIKAKKVVMEEKQNNDPYEVIFKALEIIQAVESTNNKVEKLKKVVDLLK